MHKLKQMERQRDLGAICVIWPVKWWGLFYGSGGLHWATQDIQWVTLTFDLAFRWAKVRFKSRLKSTRKPSYRWQTRATRKSAKIAPIRRAYNVVADDTGLSSFVWLLLRPKSAKSREIH